VEAEFENVTPLPEGVIREKGMEAAQVAAVPETPNICTLIVEAPVPQVIVSVTVRTLLDPESVMPVSKSCPLNVGPESDISSSGTTDSEKVEVLRKKPELKPSLAGPRFLTKPSMGKQFFVAHVVDCPVYELEANNTSMLKESEVFGLWSEFPT
jgi:hypothetical protein